MALQNRVTPVGEIVANGSRGTLFGNRGGRFHDPHSKTLHPTRRWASKQWICCVLEFKSRQRKIMGKSYTELFFLDEVTALSAGHRPCFECRRKDALAFAEAWKSAAALAARPRAGEMDAVLHRERLDHRGKRSYPSRIADLADGVMFRSGEALLTRRNGKVLQWQPEGYAVYSKSLPENADILTPPSIAAVLDTGYAPLWHRSAGI